MIDRCQRALEINNNDVVALSLSAAAGACRNDAADVARLAERVAAINPRCALFPRILGDSLAGIRQYAASEREYVKAIQLDPTDANARTELGMMYMQWGREQEAGEALEGAWALDPFNERTKFTLDLLDMTIGTPQAHDGQAIFNAWDFGFRRTARHLANSTLKPRGSRKFK